jgi:acetylornithine deacetylase/succinyl-diaminopimelate desuccinylase-like protein
VASGRRRLGTLLTIRRDLLDVLQVLDSTPSPRGRELAAALVLRDFCATRWPTIGWQVQQVGVHGANLVASRGPGPLLYSHLDTSLDDGPRGLNISDSAVTGFGLAVTRGPLAAALVAFASASSSGTLLLASSGTHRRGGRAAGVLTWLDANPAPSSAIVAKCGPPGVLWSEPGAAYLTVTVRGASGVVMLPESSVPAHGLPARLGAVLAAVSEWCADYVAAAPQIDQAGAAAGLGAISSGRPDKPDLYPSSVELGLYVVTVPGADVAAMADDLLDRVRVAVPDGCTATLAVEVVHEAASTDPTAPLVRAACAAWRSAFGEPERITGWTGSTDGVVLRGCGIPTVRLGPQPSRSTDDPQRDVLSVEQLDAFVGVYGELLEVQ